MMCMPFEALKFGSVAILHVNISGIPSTQVEGRELNAHVVRGQLHLDTFHHALCDGLYSVAQLLCL
jgi:hypothetical protein